MLTKEPSTAERVQPSFIEPMYAEAVRELPNGGGWTYEAKFDGYRCLAAKRTTDVVLWSRRGNLFTTRFAEIARACDKLPPDTLIDGEVVAIDENGVLHSTRYSTNDPRHTSNYMPLTCWFIAGATCSACRWKHGGNYWPRL
jgi:ATP-dependent DNA ligase